MARKRDDSLTCRICGRAITGRDRQAIERTAAGVMHGTCYAANVKKTTAAYETAIKEGRHSRPEE